MTGNCKFATHHLQKRLEIDDLFFFVPSQKVFLMITNFALLSFFCHAKSCQKKIMPLKHGNAFIWGGGLPMTAPTRRITAYTGKNPDILPWSDDIPERSRRVISLAEYRFFSSQVFVPDVCHEPDRQTCSAPCWGSEPMYRGRAQFGSSGHGEVGCQFLARWKR